MKLNLDDDILAALRRDLDPEGAWFSNLPAAVQIKELKPYVDRQARRDRKLFTKAAA